MDATIVEKARRGDREAQAALLANLQDPWFRVCLSLLGDSEQAGDATQESALRFLRELPKFRGDSAIRTWAIGIAINVAREMRRKESRRRDGDETELETAIPAEALNAAANAETRQTVHAALAGLPERQREAIVLRFFEEMSVAETALAMRCAPGTVKATVYQALRALKTKLKRHS